MRKTFQLIVALILIAASLFVVSPSFADPRPPAPHPKQACNVRAKGALNMAQMTCLARHAGWGKVPAKIAAAIAMAESTGRPWANSFDGGYGKGLYQIDTRYWKISRKCAKDAWCNTLYARIHVYKKWGWKAWATYTHRRGGKYPYCKYLGKRFIKKTQRRCL